MIYSLYGNPQEIIQYKLREVTTHLDAGLKCLKGIVADKANIRMAQGLAELSLNLCEKREMTTNEVIKTLLAKLRICCSDIEVVNQHGIIQDRKINAEFLSIGKKLKALASDIGKKLKYHNPTNIYPQTPDRSVFRNPEPPSISWNSPNVIDYLPSDYFRNDDDDADIPEPIPEPVKPSPSPAQMRLAAIRENQQVGDDLK